jgi:hypothetical protein
VAATAPGAPTSPAPATFSWRRLGAIATTSQVGGIAASPAGYVVLEYPRTVWFSPDGRRWSSTELPFASSTSNGVKLWAHANAVAAGPSGFVVVGGYDHTPCTAETFAAGGPPACLVGPISWSSSDGVTWQSSRPSPIPSDGSALPDYDEIVAIWPAADGWDAAVEARDSVRYHGNTLLHTKDGRTWTRLTSPPLPIGTKSGEDIYNHAGVASPDGRRVVWQTGDPSIMATTLATSADGATWRGVPSLVSPGAMVNLALAPAAGVAGPWLLLGGTWGSDMRWWRSDDLVNWRSGTVVLTGVDRAGLGAIARLQVGYVAIGIHQLDDYTTIPITMRSSDGVTWSLVEDIAPVPPDAPMFMADGPAGLIGIGGVDVGSAAWLGVDPQR